MFTLPVLHPTPRLLRLFKDYEQFHQNAKNKRLHLWGVPLVLLSLLGLFSFIGVTPYLVTLGVLYAFWADYKLAIPYTFFIVFLALVSQHLPLNFLVVIQVLGWIIQLWGHYRHEKKSPAFLRNLAQLLVGPMWAYAFFIRYYKP